MGEAVGACADTMTVRPHRPKIVMKTGFLIVQASEATQPDPTTRMLTLRLDTFYSFWTLNSIGPSEHQRFTRSSGRLSATRLSSIPCSSQALRPLSTNVKPCVESMGCFTTSFALPWKPWLVTSVVLDVLDVDIGTAGPFSDFVSVASAMSTSSHDIDRRNSVTAAVPRESARSPSTMVVIASSVLIAHTSISQQVSRVKAL